MFLRDSSIALQTSGEKGGPIENVSSGRSNTGNFESAVPQRKERHISHESSLREEGQVNPTPATTTPEPVDGIKLMFDSWRSSREYDEKRRKIQDEVDAESTEESVSKLMKSRFYGEFSPLVAMPGLRSNMFDVLCVAEQVGRDPRVAKLMEIIRHGEPDEQKALHDSLGRAVDSYLHNLPDTYGPTVTSGNTVMNPEEAMGLPLLLSAFSPSMEDFALILDMLDRLNAASTAFTEAHGLEPMAPTDMHLMLAYSLDKILAKLADVHDSLPLSAAQTDALREYAGLKTNMREKTRELLLQSSGAGPDQPPITREMLTDEVLDSAVWNCLPAIDEPTLGIGDPMSNVRAIERIFRVAHTVGGRN